jgi:antirestriction protein ArdC
LLILSRDMSVPAIRRTPMTKYRRSASTSPAQRITAAIIEKLEQGTKPWVKPWRGVPVSRPLRSCGTPYRGMNTFWLWTVADGCGYASPYWMMGWTTLAHRPSVAA